MKRESATQLTAKDFEVPGQDVIECPWPFYEALHREAPVFQPEGQGFHIISRYADVKKIMRDPDTFSNDWYDRVSDPHPEVMAILAQGLPRKDVLPTCDPPAHRQYRKLVEKVFTPARVAAMVGYIQSLIDELIDGFIGAGEADLVVDFAAKMPGAIVADMLGLPREDRAQLARWASLFFAPLSRTADLETRKVAAHAKLEFQRYVLALRESRLANSGDDLASALAFVELEDDPEAEGQARRLDDAEYIQIIESLISGGTESTPNAIGNGMLYLINHPDMMNRLRAEPSLMAAFTEEILRLESPVQGVPRIVRHDAEVNGVHLAAGTLLDLRIGAANRDPAQFPHPDQIDLDRPNVKNHLSFGSGIHFCIGASLVRQDVPMALNSLLGRLDNIALKPGHEHPEHVNSFAVRGVRSLPVTFTRRS